MKALKTIIFLLACLGLAGGAYYAATQNKGAAAPEKTRLLTDAERAALDGVRKITLVAASGETVSPERDVAGVWRLPGKAGYPADPAKIRGFLLKLSASRLLEEKTSDPARFGALGLDAGIEASLYDAAGKIIFAASFGKNFDERDATYVKPATQSAAYLASGAFSLSVAPMDWANVESVAIPSGLIASIESVSAQDSYVIARTIKKDKEKWTLASNGAAVKAKSQSALQGVASALEAFAIADVKPAASLATYFDGASATTMMYSLKDGALIMATLAKDQDGKAWARFDVASAPQPAKVGEAAAEAAQEESASPAPLPNKKGKEEHAAQEFIIDYPALQELVKERAFLIPDFVYEDATQPLAALTK